MNNLLLPKSSEILTELVAIPGPPGQENAVRAAVAARVEALGIESGVDGKGNLIVPLRKQGMVSRPRVVVTAHLDEIALMVTGIDPDGALSIASLGGVLPYKWGEGAVEILVGQIEGSSISAEELFFEPEIVARGSTANAPSAPA